MKAFDTEGFAVAQKAFAIAGDHFVEGHDVVVTVDFKQITLKALGTLVKGNDQRIMTLE